MTPGFVQLNCVHMDAYVHSNTSFITISSLEDHKNLSCFIIEVCAVVDGAVIYNKAQQWRFAISQKDSFYT